MGRIFPTIVFIRHNEHERKKTHTQKQHLQQQQRQRRQQTIAINFLSYGKKKLWITEANLGTQCASALMIAQWTKFECKLCNDITIDWNRWVLRKCSQAHTPTEQSATVIHIIVEKYECAYMNNFNDKLKSRKKKKIYTYVFINLHFMFVHIIRVNAVLILSYPEQTTHKNSLLFYGNLPSKCAGIFAKNGYKHKEQITLTAHNAIRYWMAQDKVNVRYAIHKEIPFPL